MHLRNACQMCWGESMVFMVKPATQKQKKERWCCSMVESSPSKAASILGTAGDESLGTDMILEDREITSSPSMVLCFVLGKRWKKHRASRMKTNAISALQPPPSPSLSSLLRSYVCILTTDHSAFRKSLPSGSKPDKARLWSPGSGLRAFQTNGQSVL